MEILVSIAFHYSTNHHFSITHVDWCNPEIFLHKTDIKKTKQKNYTCQIPITIT